MIPSSELRHVIEQQIFQENPPLFGISRPVIRIVDGKYVIAVFVTIFNFQSFIDCMFDRPQFWISADIENGKVMTIYQCRLDKNEEFCIAEYTRRYDLHFVGDKVVSDKYFDDCYKILDIVRDKYISDKTFDTQKYKLYLRRILKYCPLPYRKFFRSLSLSV